MQRNLVIGQDVGFGSRKEEEREEERLNHKDEERVKNSRYFVGKSVTNVCIQRQGPSTASSLLYYGTGSETPEIGVLCRGRSEDTSASDCGWIPFAKPVMLSPFGRITALCANTEDPYKVCAVGTSKGILCLFKLSGGGSSSSPAGFQLECLNMARNASTGQVKKGTMLHRGALASVAYLDKQQTIATVGEDGTIAVSGLKDLCEGGGAARGGYFKQADSCALHDALFPREETRRLLWTTGSNPCAQIQLWDLREGRDAAAIRMQDMWHKDVNTRASHLCITQHRTAPNVLITGSSNGHVCFWDVRKGKGDGGSPEGLIAAHRFHPHGAVLSLRTVSMSYDRTCLLSCGSDGQVVLIDVDQCISGVKGVRGVEGTVLLREPLGFNSVTTYDRTYSEREIILGSESEQIMFTRLPTPSASAPGTYGIAGEGAWDVGRRGLLGA